MSARNITNIQEFFIVGFPGLDTRFHGAVGSLLFFMYVAILLGNGIFLGLFCREKRLHKPMYYIILNLVVSDILFSTVTLPKTIARYWFQAGSISFINCFVQMYFVHYFGIGNSLILGVMAFDRYVAICNPLRYSDIITKWRVVALCVASWLVAHACPLMLVIRAYPLPYCADNTIVQCFCDHLSITSLACTNRAPYSIPAFAFAMILLLGPLVFIVFSYITIIMAVVRMSSPQAQLKTFSTCSPQLIIIALYFLPRCFNYLASNVGITFSADLRIALIMLYSLVPALINPLIYCFRTKDVKTSLFKLFHISQVKENAFQIRQAKVHVCTCSY